jgi:23S rRNA (uracil1939-C5)-methyltransferase
MKQELPQGILPVICRDISFEGRGVCLDKSKNVIFVNDIFPGEEADIVVDYRRAGQLYGHIKKLTKPSSDRITPMCPSCYQCGGCCFQLYAYPAQLAFKQKEVQEQFRRLGHQEVQPLPTLGMDKPYFYRNKIQMPFGLSASGEVYSGFYKEGTHVIVPIEKCYIEDERGEAILSTIRKLMKTYGILPYDEMSGRGYLRHAIIKTSYYYKEIMVVLVTTALLFPHKDEFCAELLKECPEITTLVQNINKTTGSKILGDEVHVLSGSGYIKDDLNGLHFQLSAKSFYQTNPVMTEKLYQTAMDFAELKPTDVVFDAYSGIGTIGLIAAKSVKRVISVEILPEAVEDAKKNAELNGITNFDVYADDASSFIYKLVKDKTQVDVLFMDPPRKGSDERFLNAVKTLKPARVIYVSCNPVTLARDVDTLSDLYKVSKLQPVDLFPQTPHVETVCELSLRNDDKH